MMRGAMLRLSTSGPPPLVAELFRPFLRLRNGGERVQTPAVDQSWPPRMRVVLMAADPRCA